MRILRALFALGRRLAALGLLLALLASPLLLGWPALEQHRQLAEDMATGLTRLATLQAAIEQEHQAAAASARAPLPDRIVFEADGEQALVAAVQARLVEIAAAQNLQLLSSSQLPLREAGSGRALGVRIAVRAEMGAVQALLHRIESARPFLFVEVADFRADIPPAAAPDGTAPMIDTTLDVFASLPISSRHGSTP